MSLKKIFVTVGAIAVIGGGVFLLKDKIGGSANDTQSLVRNAIANMLELESASFGSSASIKIEDMADFGGELEVGLDGNINGMSKLVPDMDYTFSVSGNVLIEGQSLVGSAKLQIIFVDKNPYVKLIEITLPPELEAQAGPLVQTFQGKWYSLPFDSEEPFSPIEQARQLKRLKELTREHDLITVTRDLGVENGIRRLAGKPNESGIFAYLKATADTTGVNLTEEDLAELQKFSQENEVTFDIWIEESSQQFQKIGGKLSLKNPNSTEGRFVIDFMAEIKDHNKNQIITAPEGADTFDLSTLLGGAPADPEKADANSAGENIVEPVTP